MGLVNAESEKMLRESQLSINFLFVGSWGLSSQQSLAENYLAFSEVTSGIYAESSLGKCAELRLLAALAAI